MVFGVCDWQWWLTNISLLWFRITHSQAIRFSHYHFHNWCAEWISLLWVVIFKKKKKEIVNASSVKWGVDWLTVWSIFFCIHLYLIQTYQWEIQWPYIIRSNQFLGANITGFLSNKNHIQHAWIKILFLTVCVQIIRVTKLDKHW